MKHLFFTFLILNIVSCNFNSNFNSETYFGGQIVNPKEKFVLLLKDDKVLDTLYLNSENKFLKKYPELKEGLYTFKHGIEFQYIYLQPKDSVLIRLNTWDFDESLVFSGNGSSKNEFLINLFLQDEKEEKKIYQYFRLDEQNFNKKIDSLKTKRLELYNEFKNSEPSISKKFDDLTKAAIEFPLYRLKEIYPYYFKKINNLTEFPTLSNNFYSYRKEVSLNEESLETFYPYQNYVVSYLYNLTYQVLDSESSKNNLTQILMNAIIDNIQLESFKNTLLKRVVVNDFLKSESSCTIYQPTLKLFLDNCSNEAYKKQVNQLVADSKMVKNNELLLNFSLESSDNQVYYIQEIINNQPSVIYFWTTEFMSTEYLVNRIKYLKNVYPEILFIGINMQSSFNEIKNETNLRRFDIHQQFRLTDTSAAHTFLTSQYPRIIIVNNKGIVQNGFTYLDSNNLHTELQKLEIN